MQVSQHQQAQDRPMQPSINGMVERYHRTLSQILRKVVGKTQLDWDLHISAAAAAYRASEHVMTGFTLNFMMLAREVRAPVDIVLGAPEVKKSFQQARTSSSPTLNGDVGRHTLLLGRI